MISQTEFDTALNLVREAAALYPAERLQKADAAISEAAREVSELPNIENRYHSVKVGDLQHAQHILNLSGPEQFAVFLQLVTRFNNLPFLTHKNRWALQHIFDSVQATLLRRSLPLEHAAMAQLMLRLFEVNRWQWLLGENILVLERWAKEHEWDAPMLTLLRWAHENIGASAECYKRLGALAGHKVEAVGDEPWAAAWRAALATLSETESARWDSLVEHLAQASGGQPNAKWQKATQALLQGIETAPFAAALEAALRAFASSNAAVDPRNADILKGLIWCTVFVENAALCRALSNVAPAAFRTTETVQNYGMANYTSTGTRAAAAGNAAVWALSQMNSLDAVAQLSRARLKVRHGGALKQIEKALAAIAARLNVLPDELEELAVPDFGLENGVLRQTFGEWTAEIDFTSGKGEWSWSADGKKPPKAVPASVKSEHGAALKELKAQAAEIEKLLPAHKERLDLMLREEKTWPLNAWRERYLEHPFLSLLARRVIWEWSDAQSDAANAQWHAFLPQERWISPAGAIAAPPAAAQIRLWHPIRHGTDAVLAWRRFLEENDIRQPFKQAHREIYVLTEAERATRTYSNRFAAHVIRQHQFNALCSARGWKNKLRLMVDDVAPPATKLLPRYNLRAEFWIEGIGDNYATDTSETGTYWRLATDQVRFYRPDAPENVAHVSGGGYGAGWRTGPAEALPLEEIPPLVFSEVMRDVDLFVGVASVGNDPTWNDGGPEGRFRTYWQDYSFGDLSESAKTRHDLLSRLLPKLKIAAQCELEGRFLRVQGQLRTYKIHLGSGNILMEPNDQYLCIVPARETRSETLFLPFEGDQTLSVILSKAFLLVADDKITDESITRQIKPLE